jgi:hypothetical protein
MLAKAIGAKPPGRVPVWLGHILAGEVPVSMMTRIRGSSNAKANANWTGSRATPAGARIRNRSRRRSRRSDGVRDRGPPGSTATAAAENRPTSSDSRTRIGLIRHERRSPFVIQPE